MKVLRDELQQPYIFRDRHLTAAENCLIFEDFYKAAWRQMNIIASAIGAISKAGVGVQEHLAQT